MTWTTAELPARLLQELAIYDELDAYATGESSAPPTVPGLSEKFQRSLATAEGKANAGLWIHSFKRTLPLLRDLRTAFLRAPETVAEEDLQEASVALDHLRSGLELWLADADELLSSSAS